MAFQLQKAGFRLKDILVTVGIPEATYHYQVKTLGKVDNDKDLKALITKLYKQFYARYGYKRITKELKTLGYCINHKKVYRLMKASGLKGVKCIRKSRTYYAYNGKVAKTAKKRLARRFCTPFPLQKLVTDITEFKCLNEEKLYLNPIMDLYNGEVIAFEMKKRPTLNLVTEPLQKAIKTIKKNATYRATIHSDQGCVTDKLNNTVSDK